MVFTTSTPAPSIRPLIQSGSLIRRKPVQVYHPAKKVLRMVNAPTSKALRLLLVVSSFV
jgi:hypothetical protein